mmetsp:Transcript_124298/g.247782  ORF Transcript_124298/g.247782 Transcript_124298/m.247782 type:complete len:121 (+) Transcript_124298:985-1347(+)
MCRNGLPRNFCNAQGRRPGVRRYARAWTPYESWALAWKRPLPPGTVVLQRLNQSVDSSSLADGAHFDITVADMLHYLAKVATEGLFFISQVRFSSERTWSSRLQTLRDFCVFATTVHIVV